MQQFQILDSGFLPSLRFKWFKSGLFSLVLFMAFLVNEAQAQVSLTFSNGYLGTQNSAVQSTSNIKNFASVGIARVSFGQSYAGTFGGTQGNDLSGVIKFYLTSGRVISLTGALNWRETVTGTVVVYGLIIDAGQNATITYGSNQTYNIVGGSTSGSSTSIGLRSYSSSLVFTDGESRNGNAATSGIIADFNAELANTPQPSSISLTNTSVIEGQNLVYTVTLSSATTAGRPQVYTFNTSGSATKSTDYNASYTFSNGVIDNGDGTITVPGGVSNFTITVATTDDVVIENIENLLVSVGSKSGLGSIADNDNLNLANCDPNSLYDNIVSSYHQSIAKKSDGTFAVWGNLMASNGSSNILSPQTINATNYPGLTGTILKTAVAGGASSTKSQAILLSTDGLYAWGGESFVLADALTSSDAFAKIATPTGGDASTKLPTGVAPGSVKMMVAFYQTLVLVTNSGNVWVLTQANGELRGIGSTTAATTTWSKVKIDVNTDLSNVISVRGMVDDATFNGLMALTADGKAYVWGKTVYLADGNAAVAKSYATQMTLPEEFNATNLPKMIAVTGGNKTTSASCKNTFYILSNGGNLYAVGDNQKRQIGDFTTTERKTWVRVKINSTTDFTNINFISAMESDPSDPAIVAITKEGVLYTWGFNPRNMIGRPTADIAYDPGVPAGFLQGTDKAIFAEMGGHTLVYIKEGSSQFCYVGHRINGSMGDGSTTDADEVAFNCTGTPSLAVCGSVPVAASTTTSTITANPTSIAADGTSTSIITVQLKQANGTNLTSTGGTVIINTSKGTISNVTDNNDGTYTAILTSSSFVETANLSYALNGNNGSNTASVNFIAVTNPVITTSGSLKTFISCSGCAVTPQSFTVSGADLSTNNLVVTAPTGVQVSTNASSGFATSINITPIAGTVTTTTVYAKLTNNATAVSSGVISVTSTGAAAKTITITTNTDNALHFDGTNDYINITTNVPYTNNAITIDAWIRTTSNSRLDDIISWGNTTVGVNVVEFRVANGKLEYILNDGTYFYQQTSTAFVNTGKWVHVAVVKSGTNVTLYIDGQVASATTTGNTSAAPVPNITNIGALAYNGGAGYSIVSDSYFPGDMDQIRVWNTAKNIADISTNRFVEMSGNETDLVASYDFNQGIANGSNSGLTVLNNVNSGTYSGSLNGFNLSGTTSNYVVGFVPAIIATSSATSVAVGNNLQLSNGLTGGTWASSNTSYATVNAAGLVTGVANGSVNITYTICNKTVTYALTVFTPVITTTGTLKTFTSCSGCAVTPQSFTVAGTNLGTDITLTAPAGVVLSTTANGTYSSTLNLTPTSATVATTTIFVKLLNNGATNNGGTINITSTGATTRTVSVVTNTDNALMFDGVDDYVPLGDVLDVTGLSYTTEAWVYWKGSTFPYTEIFTKDLVQAVAITSNNELHANFGNGFSWSSGLNSTTRIPLNKWTHVAVTRSSTGVVKMYINGVLDASSNTMNLVGDNGAIRAIGAKPLSNVVEGEFNGAIDDLKVWNTERSAADIINGMSTELTGNETNLLAYYNFNQGVANGTNTSITTLNDASASAFNGTLTNMTKTGTTSNFVDGFIPSIKTSANSTGSNNALSFNGSNGYVVANVNGTSLTTFTIETFINPANSSQGSRGILQWAGPNDPTAGGPMVLFQQNSTQLSVYVNSGYNLTATIDANTWSHIALVYANSLYTLYVNGVAVSTYTGGITMQSSASQLYLGTGYNGIWNGSLDEVRVWSVARTASEINNNMYNDLSGTESGLIVYYNMNQGVASGTNTSITSIIDKAINASNGTVTNLLMSGSSSNFVSGNTQVGSIATISAGNSVDLDNFLTGGTWSSTNTSIATVNSITGVVTGVAAGTVSISYTICGKTTDYSVKVIAPTVIISGTLKTFASCSGCNVNPQYFNITGANLTSSVIITAPTGFELSQTSGGSFSSTLTLSASSVSSGTMSVFVRLINNATTASGGNITITSTGLATQTISTTIITDNALNFDGTNDFVNIPDNNALDLLTAFTIEAWVYPTSNTGSQVIIGKIQDVNSGLSADLGYALRYNNGIIGAHVGNGTTSQSKTSSNLVTNKWQHVAMVFNGANNGNLDLYIDGVLQGSSLNTGYISLKNVSSSLKLGSYGTYFSQYFKGSMDKVKIWSVVKTQSEIATDMYTELNGNESGLVAYYDFDKGTHNGTNTGLTTLTNKTSTSSINGTLTNFSLTGNTSNYVPGVIPPITGTVTANVGANTTLSNTLTGGTWSSSNTAIATVNSATGVVTGVAVGTSTITYTICEKTVTTLFTVTVPTITTSGTLTTFNTCATTNSAAQTFTVSAQYLTSNLVLTAPAGYEIATSSGGTYSSTISIAPSSGSVSARLIYIRTTNSIVNGQSGNITITSTGATTKNIATGNALVTQNKTASVSISSNATNNTICSGASITFTANATNGGLTPTYQWKLNGSNISGATGATYTTSALSSNSTITVVMTSSISNCLSGSPATSNAINVTVNNVPNNPGAISGLTTICMNSNQVYSVTAVTGATSYTWVVTGNLSASASSTSNVINITAANTAGPGSITVYANNTCGTSINSSTLSISVNNTPAPTANYTVSANTVCLTNAAIIFTNTSSPNATSNSAIGTYSWTFGDGNFASTTNATNTFLNAGEFDVILSIQDGNQCTSSYSTRVTVNPLSVAGTASAANVTICEGANTSLSLTGYTGTIQWQSSTDGITWTNINGATSSSYTTANLTATTYYQAVVTSGICSSATSGVVTVTVSPTPTATLASIANIFTTSTSFDLGYNNTVGNPNEYSISTIAPNVMPNFVSISNYGLLGSPITVSVPASAIGTYNFNLILSNNTLGCSSAAIPFTVTVAVEPPANLTYNSPNVYTVGSTISNLNPTSTGGLITQYTIGPSLPAGLTINPTTGVISGTPSAVSSQTSYVVTGTNASGTVSTTVVITVVVAAPASLSYNTPNVYTTGTAIAALNPTSTGGVITQYSIGPSLPAGLTIDPTTGVISGTPSAVSIQTSYVVTGTNASGTVTATVVITVNSGIAPQPQGALNAVDYGLLAVDTVKLRLTTSNGVAPFTLILSNNQTSAKDTISNLTPTNNIVEFTQKRLDTTKVFTIFKLIDANNNTRTAGFTKDTTIVRLLKPQILLTLKADPAIKQPDNSYKVRLIMKIKNAGQLNLRNVQVNANLSTVFPSGISYVLDSVRILNGNMLSLNPTYTGAGTATSASSASINSTASVNATNKSLAVLDQNYLFNTGVSLNQNEEGEVAYYMSVGATTQNVVLKLQFETAGNGVLVKNDGNSSTQETTSISDDGTNLAQHPDITNQGLPLPTYVPLFPNEKIGASLNVGTATPVTGGYQFHFTAKVKNYGNVNLDSLRIQYNLSDIFPLPDQAVIVGTPTITRGNIVYNASSFDGYNNINMFDYGGDLQVGDSATYEYDLKVITTKAAYNWQNYFVAFGRSVNSGVFIKDTSMAGIDPDPNGDNDPIEKFFTGTTINYVKPAPPTVENKIYTYGDTKPANIGGLVKSTPTGTVPVWCDTKTAACTLVPPATPTEIGKYIYALRSYDTTTLLYSEVLVYDTIIIKPPVPLVVNKKYIIGNTSNPSNVANQVTGMSGSTLNYFKNALLQSVTPTLGTVPGVTRYTTSQTVNGIESDTVGFTVTMLDPNTMLHLRKIADEPKLQSNSTFNITYTFIVTNRTDEVMTNVLVADNLQNTFPSPTLFDVVSISSTGGLVFNNAFNGKTDIQLLNASSSLAAAAIDTIRMTVNLQPKGYSGTVNNQAVATATTPYGNLTINSSTTGYANETAKLPTPAVIPDLSIDIPEAFSPNRDGVNDRFIILKPFGTTLDLEVYNRWGNVVYSNSNYNNEWDGRGTNNFIGQELMDGGYYYTLKAKSANGNSQIFKGFVLIQR